VYFIFLFSGLVTCLSGHLQAKFLGLGPVHSWNKGFTIEFSIQVAIKAGPTVFCL